MLISRPWPITHRACRRCGSPDWLPARAMRTPIATIAIFSLMCGAPWSIAVDSRSAAPLWFSGTQLTQQAIDVMTEMRHAEARGLRSSDYGVEELAQSIQDAQKSDIQRLDRSLSLAVARFVEDLHSGRVDAHALGYDLDVARPKFDAASVAGTLSHTASVSTALDGVEPQFLHYRLLKTSLARYRELAAHPELNALPDPGKTAVKPGGRYSGAPSLRALLVALGDLPVSATAHDRDFNLDTDLVRGLKTYQARHGLSQDGALCRDTYRALTTPFTERIKQIELSLERWRWLPPKLDAPAIMVNIPEFRLFALYTAADLEQQMLKMDVIVGKSFPLMQTPVFAADMRYIVLHPYWDVPYSIVRRELLPLIRRDPTYIVRNEYEIVRGQTDAAPVQAVSPQTIEELARGAVRLRQKPGPKNPLGFVKFMLPNQHNVYLHGTSAPALFGGAQRAFSHGCIRVADPIGLMSYVLRENPEWNADRLATQLREPGPYRINLRRPIRVFIVYTTALAAEDGRTLFFKDIYAHDARLSALLDARSQQLLAARTLSRGP